MMEVWGRSEVLQASMRACRFVPPPEMRTRSLLGVLEVVGGLARAEDDILTLLEGQGNVFELVEGRGKMATADQCGDAAATFGV